LYKLDWDVTPNCDSSTGLPHKGSILLSAALYNYYTITELTPGRTYYTRVAAANSMGFGPVAISMPPSAVPSLQLPGVPKSVNVYESGVNQLTVFWTRPTIPSHNTPCNGTLARTGLCPSIVADGGAKLLNYVVERDTTTGFGSSNLRVKTVEATAHQNVYTAVFAGSESHTQYYIRVFATNSQGTGKQSKVTSIKTGDVSSGSPVVSQVVVFNADCAGPSANKALFLKECSAVLAPVQCMEMKCGSVEVTLRGRKIYVSQRLEKLKKNGLKLPSFKQMDFKQAGAQTSTGSSGSASTTNSTRT
jgi:hypothetical protein